MYRIHNALLLALLFPLTALALPSDSTQIVYIESDSAIYNYKTGVDVYEGHVKVNQGTTHITADKLVTKKNTEHKIAEAIAYGFKNLAHFWTLPKKDEQEINAHAKVIKFYPIQSNAVMEQQVSVVQGTNSFTGEVVQYNNAEQTITVPASAKGRAVIIYNPEQA